jgi:hypothetical protein
MGSQPTAPVDHSNGLGLASFVRVLSALLLAMVIFTSSSFAAGFAATNASSGALLSNSGAASDTSSKGTRKLPKILINTGGTTFHRVADKEQDTTGPLIGNGAIANTHLWPVTFVAQVGANTCTATLIGPQVLLTAAHCVGIGTNAAIDLADGRHFEGPCAHASNDDPSDPSPDWALCLLTPPVTGDNIVYEYVSPGNTQIARGLKLLSVGYGCKNVNDKPENPPILRTGSLFVDRPPSTGEQWPNWIFTTSARDGTSAFICPGDSGGAVYLVKATGDRVAIAVASGVQDDSNQPDFLASYLAALDGQFVQTFLKPWLLANSAKVCGFGAAPDHCRPRPP